MPIRGKRISDITPADIFELITQQAPEDTFLEFKHSVLHAGKPAEILEEEKDDLVKDFVSFANAAGGHIIIGIEIDAQVCAANPVLTTGDEATRVAQSLRDLAIAHIHPPIPELEVLPFAMDRDRVEWVVIVAIRESSDKPHMVTKDHQTQFMIRSGNRKRTLTYVEIQEAFLNGPQQQSMSNLLSEIKSIRTLVEEVRGEQQERGGV